MIDGIIRDGNTRTASQRGKALAVAWIDGHERKIHPAQCDEMSLMIAIELIHKRHVLVEIRIQIVTGQSHIRLNVIGEVNDLDFDALLRQ